VIAHRNAVGAIEALHVADDLRDHPAEAVADRDHPGAVKLRRLDVQPRTSATGIWLHAGGVLGTSPALGGQRADTGHLALEAKDRRQLAPGLAPAGLLKAPVAQVVAFQRHPRRREPNKRRALLARPRANVGEEAPHLDQPLMRGRALLVTEPGTATLNLPRALTRVRLLSIVAGTGTSGPPTPGLATRSDLANPTGVLAAPNGDVYIGDYSNDMSRKARPTGP
jgi:hypothetical protein